MFKMRICAYHILLILGIFTFSPFSLSFAGKDPAQVIIEERIDEIWTTGKLTIDNASIASKHWLPDLYERNDFQLLWQNPQNIKDRI